MNFLARAYMQIVYISKVKNCYSRNFDYFKSLQEFRTQKRKKNIDYEIFLIF